MVNRLVSIGEDGSLAPAAKVTDQNLPERLTTAAMSATYALTDGTLFNAKHRGVKGDGVTVDTAAINAVYNAARAAGRTTVYFPPATYIVDGPIYPDGVTTQAYGATFAVKSGTTQNYGVLQIASACTILGLTIDLNKQNTPDGGNVYTAMGVYVMHQMGWQNVILRDMSVQNGHQIGIWLNTGSTTSNPAELPKTRGLVTNCYVGNCRFGIWNTQTSGVKIVDNHFAATAEDAILDSLTDRTLIQGNTITQGAGGHGVVVTYSARTRIIGNDIEGCGGGGITIGGGDPTKPGAVDWIISGNTTNKNLQHGIWIDTTLIGAEETTVYCNGVISGNVCSDNTIHGIYLHNARIVSVTGNAANGNQNSGILADSYRLAISGNNLTGNVRGLYLAGHVAGYGSHEIGRNVIAENTNNYIYDSMGAVSSPLQLRGVGVPAIPAPVGSTYNRTDGGAGTTLYVKESGGTTSTGWVAK